LPPASDRAEIKRSLDDVIEVDANDKVLREYVVSPRPITAAA